MVGFRVMPAYIEYYSVQKALEQALDRREGPEFRAPRSATRSRSAPMPGTSNRCRRRDVEIVKTKNEVTASASWNRKLPLVANVSLFLEFEASATK